MLTIYSQPGCGPCRATIRHAEKAGIPHEVIDVTADKLAAATIKGLGYSATPVVVFDEYSHWTGYRPERMDIYAPVNVS